MLDGWLYPGPSEFQVLAKMCSKRTENMNLVFWQGPIDEVLAFGTVCMDV